MQSYEKGRSERVAAENNHHPTSIWPPCPPEAVIGRGLLASTNGAHALQGGPTLSPTSHQPPHLSFSLWWPLQLPRLPDLEVQAGGGLGRAGGKDPGLSQEPVARERKLGMDLPEVLPPLSLPTSPPLPTQCGEDELRDLYLSPSSASATCMPHPPGYSAASRTGAGGLRASLPVEKGCPQARREHPGTAAEVQQHRSEGNLRPGQKWANSNSTLYNNSLG